MEDKGLFNLLNLFLDDSDDDCMRNYQGVRYRYLRVGTRTTGITQYNRYVIGNNYKIYCLDINKKLHLDMEFDIQGIDMYFPFPISKRFAVSALFWSNGLLKSQNPW